jgi:hypothetical protein
VQIIFTILTIVLFSSFPQLFAQQISLGDPANQDLEISITENGEVHVIHNIVKSSKAQQVLFVNGTYSNLKIYDDEGFEPTYSLVTAPTNELITSTNEFISLFPTSKDVIVEYNLEDVLYLINGTWRWDYLYLAETVFYFPEKVDLLFANANPVLIGDNKGMKCHGCQVTIQYVFDEPIFNQIVKWEDEEFTVVFRTLSEITLFTFEQPRRIIIFDINEPDQFVTMFIPLELLWNPYDVYLNGKNINKNRFLVNDTHVGISVKPETSGTISIIGTSAVPEFPIFIPLFVALTAVIILQFRSKLNLRQNHMNKIHIHQF